MSLRKSQRKVNHFTLMVAGTSGSGKSTFINTLFDKQIIPATEHADPSQAHLPSTLKINQYSFDAEEHLNKLFITVIDTPGFNANIQNEDGFKDILGYIEAQHDLFLREETRIRRNPKFQDTRVHVLLYFIPPKSCGLRQPDIQFMKMVSNRVNVIPVIAKSDGLTSNEVEEIKSTIKKQIQEHKIVVFNFPSDVEQDSFEMQTLNDELRKLIPFTVIGAENVADNPRGRKYDWGRAEVDNVKHCDFSRLRSVVLGSHFDELKDVTSEIIYENYRTETLSRANTKEKLVERQSTFASSIQEAVQ